MARPRDEFNNLVEMLKKSTELARKGQIKIHNKHKLEIACFSNVQRIEARGYNSLIVHPKGAAKIEFGVTKDILINNIDVNNFNLNYYRPTGW